jgi:predicted dienelactone hydrolase
MATRMALALLLVARGAAAAPAGDPTAPGPYAVGFTRITMTRQATLGDSERLLAPVVWYPAEVRAEPARPLGYVDAAVRTYPLLVYSHGGCAYAEASSFLTKALASWGFVVVAPTHPGDTFYDGLDVCDFAELRATTLVGRLLRSGADGARPDLRHPASSALRGTAPAHGALRLQ